jgi:ATP-dependent RNA helicase DDX21
VLCTYHDRAGVIHSLVQIYSSSSQDGRAIVFCETKKEADELSVSHDIKAEAHVLHGDIPQDKRELVLKVCLKNFFKKILKKGFLFLLEIS